MTVFNEDTVKVVAEMINLSNVKDEAATALASDLEFQVRELIQVGVLVVVVVFVVVVVVVLLFVICCLVFVDHCER